MLYLHNIIDFTLNLDTHLGTLLTNAGNWSYVLLFFVIFAETGLVIAPFLPGDSLLFIAGALATHSSLNIHILGIVLMAAAIIGNTVNYSIGYWIGPKVFHFPKSRWFNPIYLQRAHAFYEKYGGRAIIIARFLPILRTFAPFVAGIARMSWQRFQLFNVLGSVLWVAVLLYLGYFFGNVPVIKNNFDIVIIVIIIASILPPVIGIIKHRLEKN